MDEQPSSDDLREFLKSLTAHEVEYLLIGGFAVALRSCARARNTREDPAHGVSADTH